MSQCPRCTTPLRANGKCGPCTFHWGTGDTSVQFATARPQPGFTTLVAAAQARMDAQAREQGGAS